MTFFSADMFVTNISDFQDLPFQFPFQYNFFFFDPFSKFSLQTKDFQQEYMNNLFQDHYFIIDLFLVFIY